MRARRSCDRSQRPKIRDKKGVSSLVSSVCVRGETVNSSRFRMFPGPVCSYYTIRWVPSSIPLHMLRDLGCVASSNGSGHDRRHHILANQIHDHAVWRCVRRVEVRLLRGNRWAQNFYKPPSVSSKCRLSSHSRASSSNSYCLRCLRSVVCACEGEQTTRGHNAPVNHVLLLHAPYSCSQPSRLTMLKCRQRRQIYAYREHDGAAAREPP